MASLSDYKGKNTGKKSNSSKAGLSQLINFVHNGNQEFEKTENISIPLQNTDEIDKIIKEKEALLEKEFKKKLKAKEKELKEKLKKDNDKDITNIHPIIFSTPSLRDFIEDGNCKIKIETVFKLINNFDKWDSNTKRLFNLIALKTHFGKLENVNIGRRELERTVHSSFLSESKNQLLKENVIKITEGLTGSSKRVTSFYSLNLQALLN